MTLKQRPATQTVPQKVHARNRLVQGFHACRAETAVLPVQMNRQHRDTALGLFFESVTFHVFRTDSPRQ